jgi:hypothetical protein
MAPTIAPATSDRRSERRTWFRLLVLIHIALVFVLMADVWERNLVAFPGIVPIGMFMVAIQAGIALLVILPLASLGVVVPAVFADVAAALLLPPWAGALAPVLALGFGAAAGIGLTVQIIVIRDWRSGSRSGTPSRRDPGGDAT